MVFITKSFNPKWFLIMSSVNSMSSGKESMVTVKMSIHWISYMVGQSWRLQIGLTTR